MKKILLLAVMAIALGLLPRNASAQTTTSFAAPLIWGASPFQDSLWAIDTTTWQVVRRIAPSLPGFTITGITGMAQDPITGITYAIMKVSGVTGRVLGRIDLNTGVCASVNPVPSVGNLGTNFSSITFDETGQMWGATGDGASPSESLFKIDKNTSVTTLIYAMGNGVDGEVLCFNRFDDHMYHWSGNGTVVMEKWPVNNVAYTPTNIVISGTSGGETFGMLYNGPSSFICSNIASNLKRVSTTGVYGASVLSFNPDDLRGLIMLPYFTPPVDSVCLGTGISITAGGHQLFDSLYFHWGDGNVDSLAVVNGVLTNASHTYASAGTYTINVETFNGFGGDTVYTVSVTVNPMPVVALGGLAAICSGDSTQLSANAPAGTYQWYMNGVLVAGETSSSIMVGDAGIYNMICTNSFGCADSSSTGINVVNSTYPVVQLGNDTADCVWYVIDAGNAGSTFLWNNGPTTQMDTVMSSGGYAVTVTNIDGCATYDSINVTINPLPIVNVGADTSDCVSVTVDAGNPGSTYLWCDGSTTQTATLTSTGTCVVMVTDTNGCTANDTISVTIFGNPTVSLSAMMDSMCSSTPPIVLMASPSGGTFSGTGVSPNTFTPSVAGPGVHTALYVYTDGNGCTGSDSTVITVFANPTVTASATPSTVCADDADVALTGSPAGGTFTGTSVTGSNFDPSVGAGTYNITYTFTDVNGCAGTDVTSVQVNACVGIEETSSTTFTLFPNPSTGMVNLNLPEADATVEVMDVLGNVIVAKQFNNSGIVQLDLSAQSNGVYFVRVNGTNAQRLIIQK